MNLKKFYLSGYSFENYSFITIEDFISKNKQYEFRSNLLLFLNHYIRTTNRRSLSSYLNALSKSNYIIKSFINGDYVIYKAYLGQNNDVVSFEMVNYNLIKKILMMR